MSDAKQALIQNENVARNELSRILMSRESGRKFGRDNDNHESSSEEDESSSRDEDKDESSFFFSQREADKRVASNNENDSLDSDDILNAVSELRAKVERVVALLNQFPALAWKTYESSSFHCYDISDPILPLWWLVRFGGVRIDQLESIFEKQPTLMSQKAAGGDTFLHLVLRVVTDRRSRENSHLLSWPPEQRDRLVRSLAKANPSHSNNKIFKLATSAEPRCDEATLSCIVENFQMKYETFHILNVNPDNPSVTGYPGNWNPGFNQLVVNVSDGERIGLSLAKVISKVIPNLKRFGKSKSGAPIQQGWACDSPEAFQCFLDSLCKAPVLQHFNLTLPRQYFRDKPSTLHGFQRLIQDCHSLSEVLLSSTHTGTDDDNDDQALEALSMGLAGRTIPLKQLTLDNFYLRDGRPLLSAISSRFGTLKLVLRECWFEEGREWSPPMGEPPAEACLQILEIHPTNTRDQCDKVRIIRHALSIPGRIQRLLYDCGTCMDYSGTGTTKTMLEMLRIENFPINEFDVGFGCVIKKDNSRLRVVCEKGESLPKLLLDTGFGELVEELKVERGINVGHPICSVHDLIRQAACFPRLQRLRIIWYHELFSDYDVTEGTVELLRRCAHHLEELILKPATLKVGPLCDFLVGNTSLRKISVSQLLCDNQDLLRLYGLLEDNTALEELTSVYLHRCEVLEDATLIEESTPIDNEMIEYYTVANRCGRGLLRDQSTSARNCLSVLIKAITAGGACSKDPRLIYNLLRHSPFWMQLSSTEEQKAQNVAVPTKMDMAMKRSRDQQQQQTNDEEDVSMDATKKHKLE